MNNNVNKLSDIVLYHGSRGGIDGEIMPSSRIRCDFGRGFYMGESPNQAKGLVIEDSAPVFYKLLFRISEIPSDRILYLEDTQWLFTILACRKSCTEFNDLQIAKKWEEYLSNYDVVYGKIADDRMNEAIKSFSDYGLTDKGLFECLQHVKYGNQFVAKTEFACGKIDILEEKKLYGKELDDLRHIVQRERMSCRNIIKEMQVKHQRDGLYLNELIEQEKLKEQVAINNNRKKAR